MEYTSPAHDAPPVDGYILQAPACDSDAFALEMGEDRLKESVEEAKRLIDAGKGHQRMTLTQLPAFMRDTPISAWRWYALGAAEYVRPSRNSFA
jgi:hypothetical protein